MPCSQKRNTKKLIKVKTRLKKETSEGKFHKVLQGVNKRVLDDELNLKGRQKSVKVGLKP